MKFCRVCSGEFQVNEIQSKVDGRKFSSIIKVCTDCGCTYDHESKIIPPVQLLKCQGSCGPCDEIKTVQMRVSMTAYVWDGKGEDPNKDVPLCDCCWEFYEAYWKERWQEYYSGVL